MAGARRNRKGVSTLVGITIFLALFAMAISFTFLWTQNSESYISATASTIAVDRVQVSEQLILNTLNNTALLIENPTSQLTVVTYIMSNNSIWTVNAQIAPFGNVTLNLGGSAPANGNFEVATQKGNIFFSTIQSQLTNAAKQTWDIKWYWNDTTQPDPTSLDNLTYSTLLGESYWNKLSLDWEFGAGLPVVGTYAVGDGQILGLTASTTLLKLTNDSSLATINYKIDNSSRIGVAIDGAPQDPLNLGVYWYNSSNYAWFTISGDQYSYHTVTVYYYSYGNYSQQLYLNVVNATFAP
jgi:hypothetical protein